MSFDFQKLPHAGIRSLVPYKPGKSIEELAREKNITDIIKLASNENPLGCSPLALAALQSISEQVVATYPSTMNHRIVPKLASKLKINAEQLLLSNGSDYLFSVLLKSFVLHREKHILTHDFTFSSYPIQAKGFNIPVRSVPINEQWEVNVDSFIQACNADTGIIFLANPNNPTGILTPQSDIKRLLESIPQSTLFVLDEAYYEYAASQLSLNSIDWLASHPNLIITRTFSKIYGLAGLRLGYVMANPDIINIIQRVQLPFAVNQAALIAAEAALDDEAFLNLSLKTNSEGMEQMRKGLERLNLSYLPSAGNFLTFDCQEDAMPLYNFLLDKGIIVRPLHPYKMNHFIRITIGTKEQNLRLLNALNSYYNQNNK